MQKTKIDELMKLRAKRLLEGFEIAEIRLNNVSHEALKKDLEKTTGVGIHEVTSLLGIPVIVDDNVPQNIAWLIKERVEEKQGGL